MFAVTLSKGESKIKHLVLGVNEKLLKGSENEGVLASLRMAHKNSDQPEQVLVQLWSDGTVRALDSNNRSIPVESLDFCPENTTYIDGAGDRIEHAPATTGKQSSSPASNEARRPKNYTIKPNGFIVEDIESGDGLAAVIKDGVFHGVVLISDIGAQGPLTPWPLNKNPFEDDNHFFGTGMSPQGQWSFSIHPSVPFSQILREAREQYAKVGASN